MIKFGIFTISFSLSLREFLRKQKFVAIAKVKTIKCEFANLEFLNLNFGDCFVASLLAMTIIPLPQTRKNALLRRLGGMNKVNFRNECKIY